MEFQGRNPIYKQIADQILIQVISGLLAPGKRVKSVRDLALELAVNPNTVARAYGYLSEAGIIINQRGIGYFLSKDALERAIEIKKKKLTNKIMPTIFREMNLLSMDLEELQKLYIKYNQS